VDDLDLQKAHTQRSFWSRDDVDGGGDKYVDPEGELLERREKHPMGKSSQEVTLAGVIHAGSHLSQDSWIRIAWRSTRPSFRKHRVTWRD